MNKGQKQGFFTQTTHNSQETYHTIQLKLNSYLFGNVHCACKHLSKKGAVEKEQLLLVMNGIKATYPLSKMLTFRMWLGQIKIRAMKNLNGVKKVSVEIMLSKIFCCIDLSPERFSNKLILRCILGIYGYAFLMIVVFFLLKL